MPLRTILPTPEGRGLVTYRLAAGEAFTVRTANWTHRVIFDPSLSDRTFPWVGLRAQDGRLIAGCEAPSFSALGTFAIRFGGITPWPGSTVDQFGTPSGDPMVAALPDVLLGPGCTVECGALGDFSNPRTLDVVTDLVLTVSDAGGGELAVS